MVTGCIPKQVSNWSLGFFLYEVGGLVQTISEVPIYLIILPGNSDVFQEIILLVKLVFPYYLSIACGIKPNISLVFNYNIYWIIPFNEFYRVCFL